MKKECTVIVLAAACTLAFAGGPKSVFTPWIDKWPSSPITVVCPWAVGGVVDIVNRKLASYGEEVFGQPVVATNDFIRADAISMSDSFLQSLTPILGDGGNVAFINYLKTKANDPNFIIGSENAFAIAPNLKNARTLPFSYQDFEPIISLCSAVFVLTASTKLNITNLESLKAYGQERKLTVAVGGTTSIENFMIKELFKELNLPLEVITYNSANLALNALIKEEVHLAVSHQSQAKRGVLDGSITPVVLFDEKGKTTGIFAGVKGVGEYGYTAYCKNRSFLLARKGTDAAVIKKMREGYKAILAQQEVMTLFESLMIEIEPLDSEAIDKHLAAVQSLVNAHR